MMDKRDACRELIRSGDVGSALNMLGEHFRETNNPLQNDALLLAGQLREYHKNKSLGLPVDATTPNRIAKAVLDLLDHPDHPRTGSANGISTRMYLAGAGILLIVALIVWLISRTGDVMVTHGAESPIKKGDNNVIEYHNTVDTNASK